MTRVIGPPRSRRRRWLFLCTAMAAIAAAVVFIPSALAVHDNGVFQLDGNASTALPSTPPAAEDWDLICKANQVTSGTLAAPIDASTTSITVTETNGISALLPRNIQIGSEQMTVTARSGSANPFTYTVTRGIDGTTAATHSMGDTVLSGCLFQHGYTAPSGTTKSSPSSFVVDQSNNAVDDILKTGTKDDNNINSWSWTTAGTLDKNDLTDGAVAEYTCSDVSTTCGTGHASDKLIYFMADRYGISGSANVAFWFFQSRVQQYADGTGSAAGQCVTSSGCPFTTDGKAPNGIAAGQPGSNLSTHVTGTCGLPGFPAAPPGCNWGDILVIGAFGPHASLQVFQWVGAGNATKNYNGTNSCFTAACSLQPLLIDTNADCNQNPPITSDNACAVANTTVTPSPWILPQKNISGKPVGDQFNADTVHGLSSFFEGGINLTGLGLTGTCFSSFLINSRSSAAGDSELHDKLVGQLSRCAPNLTTQQSVAANANGTPGTVHPGDAVTDTATVTVSGATSPADATGTVDFTLCGPVASIPASGNVCGVSGVGTAPAGTSKPLNNANCSPPSGSNTDGISCAVSDQVNTSASKLATGYYCFKATANLTNYNNPDPATNNSTECFRVLQVATTTTTHPQENGSNITTALFGDHVTDHAQVDAANSLDGNVTGTVTFTICDPDVLAANNETTCDTGGTTVGSAVTLTPTANASPPSSTADSSTFVTANKIGTWCWRAVYTPDTGSFYTGSSDHSSGECFTVSKIDTTTTTHPQENGSNITTASFGDHVTDHAQVDAANALDGDVNGTVTFTICDPDVLAANTETTCDTGGTQVGTAVTVTPTSGASPPSSTADSSTFVTANKLGTWCWRAVFTPATGSPYNGSSDHGAGECFTVSTTSTASSTQDWLPNDHATITAAGVALPGTLSITLRSGSCTGAIVYTEPVPNNGAFTASTTGTTYDTTNSTFKVSTASASDYFWRIVFTPTSSSASGVTKCEQSTLTINNNP